MLATALLLAATKSSSSGIGLLLPLILIFAAGYLLIIRPNQQRQKKQRETTSQVSVGDEIVTIGGIVGVVVAADEEHVTIRCEGADGATLKLVRQAIGRRVEPNAPSNDVEPGEAPTEEPDGDA